MTITPELIAFIASAKKAAYAGGGRTATPSRPGAVDLPYQEGEFTYLDTYLGGYAFIGQEAVWRNGAPVWGMNYYGSMTIPHIPEGFSHFLKSALLRVPAEAPFRGPAFFQEGAFAYTCSWMGALDLFDGRETIYLEKQPIYALSFHGGLIIP